MNYLLVGGMGSGKDTVASLMPGYIRASFAENVKDVVKLIRTRQIDKACEIMTRFFDNKPPDNMIEQLVKFSNYPVEEGKDRTLLQHLGTNWARAHDPDVWIRGLKEKIKPENKYVITDCRFLNEFLAFEGFTSVYVYADTPIRIMRLMQRDGNFKEESLKHASEQEVVHLGELSDIVLYNNSDLETLKRNTDEMLRLSKDGLYCRVRIGG